MFGIDREERRNKRLDKVLSDTLSRQRNIAALDSLTTALGTAKIPDDLRDSVIALDSSTFLRLAASDKSADVIDYLNTQHLMGVILPGQSVQEFWNNRFNVIPSLAKGLRSSFENFSGKIAELDGDFGDFKKRFELLISDFETDHGHVFDEQTVSKTFRMLDALKGKAIVPFVNRDLFSKFAAQRQNTKTPPGFRDKANNDGDFFIWLDILRGAQLATSTSNRASWLVLVTNDKKDDWSRDGTPHPLLTAELSAVCGLKLCIVDLNRFLRMVETTAQ